MIGLTGCLLLFLCVLLLKVTIYNCFSLLLWSKLTYCGPADGNMTPRHSLHYMLSSPCLSLSLTRFPSVFISYAVFLSVLILFRMLSLSFRLYFIFSPPLLMLFQVFYLYSITTKNKYLSGDISCSMLCLLAVFIAYTAHSTIVLSPPFLLLMCFHVLTPSSPPILDVFQAVPEKPQWDCRQTEQSSNPRSRLQHQGHGQ